MAGLGLRRALATARPVRLLSLARNNGVASTPFPAYYPLYPVGGCPWFPRRLVPSDMLRTGNAGPAKGCRTRIGHARPAIINKVTSIWGGLMGTKPIALRYKQIAAAVALACVAPASVLAQQTDVDEEILVTGSFISRPADRPQPVSVMDQAEIEANQRVTLVEIVRDMPQVSSANVVGNWNTPTNSINLRGLGSRSTLVLLNGQRMTIDANAGSQVDINNLAPQIMVERIELLLDGASALYGSDAVAGVANFITRDRFEGMEFNVSSQWAETQTDTPEIVTGGIFGTGNDTSHLVMAFEMQRRDDKLQEEDRFDKARLENGLITALWNPGTFLAAPGAASPGWFRDPYCNQPEIGGTPNENEISDPAGFISGPFCRGLLSLQRTSVPEATTMTGMAVFTRDFEAGGLESFKIEANYARAESRSSYGTGVPLLALPAVAGQTPLLPSTNPGVWEANRIANEKNLSFPIQDYGTIFSRQLSPLDGDDASTDSRSLQNTYRLAMTVEGLYGDSTWDWRVVGTFSQNDQEDNVIDTITDRYMRALQGYGGPACKWNFVQGAANDPNVQPGVGNCQYWNPFASRLLANPTDGSPIDPNDPNSPLRSQLYNSPELLDWMMYGGTNEGHSNFQSLEWVTTGELWEMAGGATGLAVGAQHRKQELKIEVDPIQKDGGLGFSPQILRDWFSDRETNSVFAELVMFPSENFEIDIAARYEETLGQSSTEPKLSMLWTPTDNLYVRATAGSSFRLASETQLFGIGGGSVGRDTIGGEVTQATGIAVGNPALLPEESDNWTVGFTWDITDNFTMDLTYWDYEFTNLVTSTDAAVTLRADMADGYIVTDGPANWSDPAFIAANIASPNPLFFGRPNEVCEITGRWAGVGSGDPLPAGCVTGFDIEIFRSSWINQDVIVTNGFDLTLDWRKDLSSGGRFGTRFVGAFTTEYAGISSVTGQLTDVVGTDGFNVAGVGTNPDLRANLIVSYGKGNHNVRGTFRYTSGTERTDPNPLLANFDEGSYTQLDLVYSYDLSLSNPATLTFSVLNATDEEPPLTPNGLLTYNQGLYDGRGRMARIAWSQGF
jgi:iron complex outermembrane receptor protein